MGIIGKWVVHKRHPDEGRESRPWGVYTPQGLEMHIFKTWSEAMAVATVLTSMTTRIDIDYDTYPTVDGGYAFNLNSSAKLRVYHELVRTSWVVNKNVGSSCFDHCRSITGLR